MGGRRARTEDVAIGFGILSSLMCRLQLQAVAACLGRLGKVTGHACIYQRSQTKSRHAWEATQVNPNSTSYERAANSINPDGCVAQRACMGSQTSAASVQRTACKAVLTARTTSRGIISLG